MDFLYARGDTSFATGTRRFRGSLRLPPPGWTRRARSLGASPALPDLGHRPRGLPAPHPRSGPRATLPPPTPRTPFGPQALAQAPRRCPTAKGSAATSRRPPAPPTPSPGMQESPVAPGPPSSSRAPEALPPRPRDVPKRALDPDSRRGPRPQAPQRASRPRFPLPRPGDLTHPRAQPRRRGRQRAAAPTARRAAPAAPCSPPLGARPGCSRRSLRLFRSLSHFPALPPWRSGVGGPAQTGRAAPPTSRR